MVISPFFLENGKHCIFFTALLSNIFTSCIQCIRVYIICMYVRVNLSNKEICKLSENCRQFVKCLFQSVNLQNI